MVHDGHRERLRNRFLAAPESFEDHELLELLLFYAIPRKNTNEIAHSLLDRFGSIKGILDAGVPSLMAVDDIGESTAVFFRALSQAMLRYRIEEGDSGTPFDTYAAIGKYLKNLFVGTDNEMTYLLLFDSSQNLIICEKLSEGYSCGNVISNREIVMKALTHNAASAIIAHNHPGGKAIPSREDIYASTVLESSLDFMGVRLIDHFVVAENKCVPILHKEKTELYNC